MENKIVLATSISPRNIENQQKAMESWIASGFKVISCNVRVEITQIENFFPDVEFVELPRSAEEMVGKPCPYIYDMLQVLKAKAGDVCGIINSDIHLRNCSEEMYHFIKEHAAESLVYARRQEVKTVADMDNLNSRLLFGGIDTFIFPKKVIDRLEDDGLIIGQAVWDYWLPIMLKRNEVEIGELVNPITFHIEHAGEWNVSLQSKFFESICQKYFYHMQKSEAAIYITECWLQIIGESKKLCYMSDELKKQKELAVDYQIDIPYDIQMNEVFVEASLWIMDTYNLKAIQVYPYLCGNQSHMLRRENCIQLVLEKFYEDIEGITVYQEDAYNAQKHGEDVCIKTCKIHLCDVMVEEDFNRMWESQKIKGRIFVFPAGRVASAWVKNYKQIATEVVIKGLIDNNPAVVGTRVHDTEVYGMSVLKNTDEYDHVLVISNLYIDELVEQLGGEVSEEKIVVWNPVIKVE